MLTIYHISTSKLGSFREDRHHKVVVAMPSINMPMALRAADVMMRRTEQPGLLLVIEDDLRLGFIMTANLAYARTQSDYFAYVAQDAFPGHLWLDYGLDTMKRCGAGLLAFNEGSFFGKVAAFGLVHRDWTRSLYRNFLFYPQYKSHYADVELSVLALHTSNLAFNPNAILMEVDFEKHLKNSQNKEDALLYTQRAESGFDGRMPPFTPATFQT